MKRIWICAAALLLTGCSASATQSEQKAEYDDGWRELYASLLRGTTAKRFSLVYINDDDIPELTLHWSDEGLASHADHPKLYTYNSMLADLGSISDGGMDNFSYLERRGIVISSFISTGAGFCNYLRLENGTLTPEHQITMDMIGTHSYTTKYTLDGNDCTDEEYQAVAAQYDVTEKRSTTGEYAVNEENIQTYVLNS